MESMDEITLYIGVCLWKRKSNTNHSLFSFSFIQVVIHDVFGCVGNAFQFAFCVRESSFLFKDILTSDELEN